jgi:Fe-S-cluster containining protein
MITVTNAELDSKTGRIVLFTKKCIDELHRCKAMCCRILSTVYPTKTELEEKLYEIDEICLLTEKACEKEIETCINREYRLKKQPDGSCIYLDQNNRCGIYERRPDMCKIFFCRSGWRLAGILPEKGQEEPSSTKMEKSSFIERLKDDMIFVFHPLIKLHAVFYLQKKKEIIFLKEMIGTCKKFNSREGFYNPNLNENQITALIDLFERKDALKTISQRFCDQQQISLVQNEFYEIVWLLNKHNIILSSKNFCGMLSGMGGI